MSGAARRSICEPRHRSAFSAAVLAAIGPIGVACQCEVVILDQESVIESASMVVGTTAVHGVLFQQAPARSRLAGVV